MPQVVRITSKRPGFRRAGLAHPDQPVEHPIDRFTKAELAALKAEPMLVVDIIDRPDPEPGDGKGKGHQEYQPADAGIPAAMTGLQGGREVRSHFPKSPAGAAPPRCRPGHRAKSCPLCLRVFVVNQP